MNIINRLHISTILYLTSMAFQISAMDCGAAGVATIDQDNGRQMSLTQAAPLPAQPDAHSIVDQVNTLEMHIRRLKTHNTLFEKATINEDDYKTFALQVKTNTEALKKTQEIISESPQITASFYAISRVRPMLDLLIGKLDTFGTQHKDLHSQLEVKDDGEQPEHKEFRKKCFQDLHEFNELQSKLSCRVEEYAGTLDKRFAEYCSLIEAGVARKNIEESDIPQTSRIAGLSLRINHLEQLVKKNSKASDALITRISKKIGYTIAIVLVVWGIGVLVNMGIELTRLRKVVHELSNKSVILGGQVKQLNADTQWNYFMSLGNYLMFLGKGRN